MKKLLLLLLCTLPLSAAAKKYTLQYKISPVEIVNNTEAVVELIYSHADAGKVVYSSDEIEAPLRFSMSPGGSLTITKARKNNYKVSTVKIYYDSYITGITNTGTGDVQAKTFNAPVDLKINNSGTGDVEFKSLNVKTLKINNSGTGDIAIDAGKVVSLKINNSGTGDIKAKLISSEAEISNSGTGDVTGVRTSSKKMSLSNCGTGKIVIKQQKPQGDVKISPQCDRNIRFIK